MGRPSKGWRLKDQPGTDVLAVAWTQPNPKGGKGKPIQRSTGERVRERAAVVAARIYAAAMRGEKFPGERAQRLAADDLIEKGGQWLKTRADLDRDTKRTYALYFRTHLGPHFSTLAQVSADAVAGYCSKRLRYVTAATLRHELSALRKLVAWTTDEATAWQLVPKLPKSARGTSYEQSHGKRRRGKPSELTEAETLAIIAKLPAWSRASRVDGSRFPIQARFIVKYETGLREALLDQLSTPEHWDPARPSELRITTQIDKNRLARVVPLTPAAQAALESVAVSAGGTVFGSHDYRSAVRSAARASGLPEARVKTLAPNDLRHARATHLGASPHATMTGMMHMFGWTQPATAARYMHPTQRAAEKMLAGVAGVGASGAAYTNSSPTSKPSTVDSTAPSAGRASSHDDEDETHGFG